VATLASQLSVGPTVFATYLHGRDTTRREHLLELQRDFGFRSFSAAIYRELAGWLLPLALSTDVGPVLVGAVIDELRERKVLAPALSTNRADGLGDASARCFACSLRITARSRASLANSHVAPD